MWEEEFELDDIKEIRTKTTVFFGVGAINKINEIADELCEKQIKRLLVVTGKSSYKKNGTWDVIREAFESRDMEYLLFDKVTSNPNSDDCDSAIKLAREFGIQGVLGIGGGSPIDTAKTVAVMYNYPDFVTEDLFKDKFTPTKALPIIAINTTHGTGTEVNRYAVMSLLKENYKPAIGYDFCYPMYAIDDPQIMTGLSPEQTVYTAVDAVNHVIEAATTKNASPYCIVLAKETVRLVKKYLPIAIENPKDLKARYYLTYAAMIAGICFDNGFLHYTHALEHPLSGMKPSVIHGQGLGILLPAVIKHIYSRCEVVLKEILAPLGDFGNEQQAYDVVKRFLNDLGMNESLKDLGFTQDDIPRLVELTLTTPSLDQLLEIAPTVATPEIIKNIYEESL